MIFGYLNKLRWHFVWETNRAQIYAIEADNWWFLCCRVEYQLPNLIVGSITKESLYNAFENGISAEQVIVCLCLSWILCYLFKAHNLKQISDPSLLLLELVISNFLAPLSSIPCCVSFISFCLLIFILL